MMNRSKLIAIFISYPVLSNNNGETLKKKNEKKIFKILSSN